MQSRLFEYLYWAVVLLWITANAAWFVTTKRLKIDVPVALIWGLVGYSLWRRWRRAQRAGGTDDGEG